MIGKQNGDGVLKATRTKSALIVVVAALALVGCGSGGGSGGKDPASSSPAAQTDPYQKAPWRLQVVNLLNALRTPQDGRYRSWLSDDPTYWTRDFSYTPYRVGDPGWSDRDSDGAAVVYPGKMNKTEKNAFFKAITRDNTVLADTLTVTDPGDETVAGDNRYKFRFKVKTSDGHWLTGTAIGSPGTSAASGRITRLTYDTPKS